MKGKEARPSLENLVEGEDLGFEILHQGDLEITQELADLCSIQEGTSVLDIASEAGEIVCYLTEKLGAHVGGWSIRFLLIGVPWTNQKPWF